MIAVSAGAHFVVPQYKLHLPDHGECSNAHVDHTCDE